MPLHVMVIVLLAALLHASWNFLVKQTGDKHVSMSAVVFGHTPFAAVALVIVPSPSLASIPYMLTGALLHTGYQIFLLNSYRSGDLSQVYPLARGVAPLLVALVSMLLLGISLDSVQVVAIVLIAAGIMSLTLLARKQSALNLKAVLLALCTGTFIAAYSLVDGLGARKAGSPIGFYGWLSLVNAMIYGGIMGVIRPRLAGTILVRHRLLALGGGGASFGAYALVIWAFTLAPIAMVTALRETSILFALLLGTVVLKERPGFKRIVAAMVILVGVFLMRLQG